MIDCSERRPAQVDAAAVLAAPGGARMRGVLTEGGPTLFGSFVEHDLLDELCLTIAPYLWWAAWHAGSPTGPEQLLTGMRLAHVLADDDGYLYTRYVRKV